MPLYIMPLGIVNRQSLLAPFIYIARDTGHYKLVFARKMQLPLAIVQLIHIERNAVIGTLDAKQPLLCLVGGTSAKKHKNLDKC